MSGHYKDVKIPPETWHQLTTTNTPAFSPARDNEGNLIVSATPATIALWQKEAAEKNLSIEVID